MKRPFRIDSENTYAPGDDDRRVFQLLLEYADAGHSQSRHDREVAKSRVEQSQHLAFSHAHKIKFGKKVASIREKEKMLHVLLEQHTDRINPRREFFCASLEEDRKFFVLMDGEMWARTTQGETEEDDEQCSLAS